MDRRRFLKGALGANILAHLPAGLFAQNEAGAIDDDWDSGVVRHLLPAVSDSSILIKASFSERQSSPPVLLIGGQRVEGRMNDTQGEFWQFHADGLEAGRTFALELSGDRGQALCEPWELSTFPARDANVDSFRLLVYTCAGGHDALGFLPAAVRQRLLRRALSFGPQAVIANGDHVYWDILSPRGGLILANTDTARRLAGEFDRSALVLGSDNETVLKLAVTPQIAPVYGTIFRSTPVYFLQDDHDHFENDEATDEMVTFPPSWFMIQLARASQKLFYPEFLPDANRPPYLPWSSSGDRISGLSESFGTLRFGNLAEVLLYDVRRTMTIAGPTSVFVDPQVEQWLDARTGNEDTRHLVHVPSSPLGWSAGKWGEWYPDILGEDQTLTTDIPKPYWQQGWLAQHDRIVRSLANMQERTPMIISGDLHALALGRMVRSGAMDLSANPINIALAGPISTGDELWPSAFRGVGPGTPSHVDMEEDITPLEQHGFTLVDFEPDRIALRFFRWDVESQDPAEIDDLMPFHSAVIPRGG